MTVFKVLPFSHRSSVGGESSWMLSFHVNFY